MGRWGCEVDVYGLGHWLGLRGVTHHSVLRGLYLLLPLRSCVLGTVFRYGSMVWFLVSGTCKVGLGLVLGCFRAGFEDGIHGVWGFGF